ncbi:hypothetical protein Tco_0955631 [Tanacetum coccineum]|uniref:Uncharacterized protein n=1 Tax=Tanacetum coccineum TaxID=301880 RepID=A0ABQ5E7V7_9ASTR
MVRIRLLLENLWHNSTFEGYGFVRLFLPTDAENEDFYSREWVSACIHQIVFSDGSKEEKFFVSQAWLESDCYLKIHGFDKDLYIILFIGVLSNTKPIFKDNRKVIPDLWYHYLTMMHEQECHIYHAYSAMDPQKRDEKLEELKEFRIEGDKFLHFLFRKMQKMKMHQRAVKDIKK